MEQKVIISTSLVQHISEAIAAVSPDRLFILCDEKTVQYCWPKVSMFDCLHEAKMIVIPEGDNNKTLENVAYVWQELQKGEASRHSMMVNLGGGMVTDLGGFVASTFKRGIHFINIPTTLLSLVDASVGGKTGFNFGGLKNEIGVFNTADVVVLDTSFLDTLSSEELCSGYAEMIKHGLLNSDRRMLSELLAFEILSPDFKELQRMVAESVAVKEKVVEIDPYEKGLRKALNLGHTFGHAFESFGMSCGKRIDNSSNEAITPIPHGYAVAFGIVCELYLACVKTGFPQDVMRQTVRYIRECYGKMPVSCDDYPTLYELMKHDKKNTAGVINFTLLSDVGAVEINQEATKEEIYEALDFFREN